MGEIAIPVRDTLMRKFIGEMKHSMLPQGTSMVRVYENSSADESVSQRGYNIVKGQKFLIPQSKKHQYLRTLLTKQ